MEHIENSLKSADKNHDLAVIVDLVPILCDFYLHYGGTEKELFLLFYVKCSAEHFVSAAAVIFVFI